MNQINLVYFIKGCLEHPRFEEGKEYPACWTDVVEHLTAWAKREGHTIYQLESC